MRRTAFRATFLGVAGRRALLATLRLAGLAAFLQDSRPLPSGAIYLQGERSFGARLETLEAFLLFLLVFFFGIAFSR